MKKTEYHFNDLIKDLDKTGIPASAIDVNIRFDNPDKPIYQVVDCKDINEIKESILSLKKRTTIFEYVSIILFVVDIVLSYLLVQNIVVW